MNRGLKWEFCESTLTISGMEGMEYQLTASDLPFYHYSPSIKTVIIKNGVTTIDAYTFSGCNNLEELTLPFIGTTLPI